MKRDDVIKRAPEPETCVMLAFPDRPRARARRRAPPNVSPAQRELLDAVRALAAPNRARHGADDLPGALDRCRDCSRRVGPDAAPPVICPHVVTAFFDKFEEVSARPLSLYRAGAPAVSLDERWLLRLLDALERHDRDQVRALVGFRSMRGRREAACALATALAAALRAPAV
ncbi:MAG: hypothetical protein AAFR16_02215 [Pseudomonadota bacterium]